MVPRSMLSGMNNTTYLINAILVLLVVRQIREHRLDLTALAVPVLAVGAAAAFFLHSVPGRGNDIALELICLAAGAVMGRSGDRPLQRRAPDHRFGRVGGGAGHDGARRRAHQAGRAVPARPQAHRGPGFRPPSDPGRHPCLISPAGPPRATLCP